MSSVEAIGALPGGGAFLALWKQVDGDAGTIGELAAVLRRAGRELDQVQAGVTRASGHVDAGWRGPAADAFTGYMRKVRAAATMLGKSVDVAGTHLTSAADEISEARTKLTAIADRTLDEISGLRRDATSDPDRVDQAIGRAVAAAVGEARPVVHAVSAKLQTAASGVRTATNGDAFLALHEAGSGSYLPPKGGHVDWATVPRPGEDVTAPAAATAPVDGNGGGGGGGAATAIGGGSAGPPAQQPTGDVKTWIAAATKILEQHGVAAGKLDAADINTIIEHESGGNPHAINLTDSNAAAGHPSKGLMQTIDSTFAAHALPGHTDIWNPVDNIVAGVRYALSRYGSLDAVPGVAAVGSGSGYVGY